MPNPFYVLLLVASTAFVVTALGYALGPTIAQQAIDHPERQPSPRSRLVADWLDRRGPAALGVEFAVMLVTGLLAMATDSKFAPPKAPTTPPAA